MVLGRARLQPCRPEPINTRALALRKKSVSYLLLGGAALQCVRENSFSHSLVEPSTGECSPGGATELSPALQRWEKWKERFKSRRDDRSSHFSAAAMACLECGRVANL